MKSSEIREKFLKFFEAKGHKVLPGSSLVPKDPTVLLTLAGMLQFKPIFLGQERAQFKRVATVQRCLRMVDIEKVGKTPRHHTFFEMLGNFSFGDYFKKEAIQFAWELLTKEFKLPLTKLSVAVYEKDEEAFKIWNENIGLPKNIIYRLGEENNFWAVGPTGPCGPCSEIYYDLGPEWGCGKPECAPGCDCDRYLELWNLVFIEFNRNDKGELIPLKQKGIDTGMGLERIASILQGVADNFETDLFEPIIKVINSLSHAEEIKSKSQKIIADHTRAIVNLIADGVIPENVGRGYVLRRLIRRSIHHGQLLGMEPNFLEAVGKVAIDTLKDAYPFLKEKESEIILVIKEEETKFRVTLEQGMSWFNEIVQKYSKGETISGKEVFKLHDTYGFPVELTKELAEEKQLQVDVLEFEREMSAQRERSRKTTAGKDLRKEIASLDLGSLMPTKFVGYEKTSEKTKVLAIFPDYNLVVLEKTPFYGESGGQVGDTGVITWKEGEIKVLNTYLSPKGVILHQVDDLKKLAQGVKVEAVIDASRRKSIEANHTATHLLHKVLREVLGEHVKQMGSYVGPDKLRFDFSHCHALTSEEIQKIEAIVNSKIKAKLKVEVLQKSYKDAINMGAVALFGEKYGEKVRVLKIGDYSLELCGGTHVKSTADILFFKIISESALGSGLRRIEALSGQNAKVYVVYRAKSLCDEIEELIKYYRLRQKEKELLGSRGDLETGIFQIEVSELESIMKAVDNQDSENVNKFLDHLTGRQEWLKERIIKIEKEIEHLKQKKIQQEAKNYVAEVETIGKKKVLFKKFEGMSLSSIRFISDELLCTLGSGILFLVSVVNEKVSFHASVTKDLVQKGYSAKELMGKFAEVIGGKGGGKETKAEGGGGDSSKIEEGFRVLRKMLA